jgi:hypothetical protein
MSFIEDEIINHLNVLDILIYIFFRLINHSKYMYMGS